MKTGRKFKRGTLRALLIKKHSAPRKKKGQKLEAVLLIRSWQREILKSIKYIERNIKRLI